MPEVTVGTLAFTQVSASNILGATLNGTFGNSLVPTTAGLDLYFDSVKVAACLPYGDPCWTGPGPTAWTYTFTPSQYSLLTDGQGRLSFIQTNEYFVWLGATTLTITTLNPPANQAAQLTGDVPADTAVPEPASFLLSAAAGMLALISRRHCFGKAR